MTQRHFGRQFLAALAGSTSAFTPAPAEEHRGNGRRILAALAGSTPAFTAGGPDEHRTNAGGSAAPRRFDPVADLSSRIPLRQRLPLRGMLGDRLHEVQEMADSLAALARRLYEILSPRADPPSSGLGEWFEAWLTRRENARRVSDQASGVLVAIEDLYLSDFFDLAPANLQTVFEDLGLTQAQGRDHISAFVAASARSATQSEDLLKLAAALNMWCTRLRFTLERIDEVLSDVRGADLREANLQNVDLDGLRWSTDTRWPLGWRERIVHMSVPCGPGEFEIVGDGGRDHEPADEIPLPRS